ncbi:MAG: nucleotidyltransferase family protein, partial [Mogibacterium sp.]|nr:nucleotidyltransferase family protein [Mogibacterium sp.]
MKNRTIVGIVAEYNPFHTGHRYQIRAAAEQVSADAVVAVMSGHFMQRGSFAVTDKWTRAAMALSSGVDAVIEIPVRYCLGNASIYAAAGIGLLEASGIVTHLSFGTESGDLSQLQNTAARITGSRERLEERIRELGREGHSYPRARMIADAELSGEPEIPSEPNDILALEYLRANHSMTVIPVHRQGAGYHEEIGGDTEFPSSTGLRQLLREGKDIRAFLPEPPDGSDWKFYMDEEPWFRLIRYRILNCGIEEICCAPGGEEGLAYLLRDAVRTAVSIDDLILRVKSKRYTYTRISRLLYQLLLGITRETQQEAPE